MLTSNYSIKLNNYYHSKIGKFIKLVHWIRSFHLEYVDEWMSVNPLRPVNKGRASE